MTASQPSTITSALFLCCGLLVANHMFGASDAVIATKTNEANLSPGFALGVEPHKVVSRESGRRVWEQVKYLTNFNLAVPRVAIITNRYTELGAGITFQQPDGTWADSQARFVLAPDGSVEATEIPHKVRISPDLHSIAAVKMTLPDGRLMSSTFRGLYLYDASAQQRLLVSDVTNSIGTLISSNVLVYSNCFASLQGDLVLKVTPAGLAQDVVIRESLAWIPFGEIAFDPQSTVLEAWTEFYDTPTPDKQTNTLSARTLAEGSTSELSDETLKFGDILMVPGRAYLSGTSNTALRLNAPTASRDSVRVGKTWIEQDNRRFLIERLRWREILHQFRSLETNSLTTAAKASRTPLRRATVPVVLAGVSPASLDTDIALKPRVLLAQAPAATSPAFVLDYTTVTCSGGICNGYRFEANETYYISSPITITGEATLVGGTVIKIAPYETAAGITFEGTVKCDTGPGRMVLVTSKNDNSVGTAISGSTGDCSQPDYGFPAIDISYSASAADIRYLRISHSFLGLRFLNSNLENKVWHSQFVNCSHGIWVENTDLKVRNVLFHQVQTVFIGAYCDIEGQHVTAHTGPEFGVDTMSNSEAVVTLINSLIVGIPQCVGFPQCEPGQMVCNTFSSVWLQTEPQPPAAPVFETSVLGAHYLPENSTYRQPGTSPIDQELRDGLKTKTTYAPAPLYSPISADTLLATRRPRNSNPNPEIGYSYDAIDYVAQGLLVQSGTLLATNGVVIGLDAGALSSGIRVAPGAKLISEGTADNMNRFVELRSVQEQHGSTITIFNALETLSSSTTPSELHLRFTDLPWRAGLWYQINRGSGPGVISLQDCQMSGGGIYGNAGGPYEYTLALTNNLFEGSQFTFSGPTRLHIWNNTFLGGSMTLYGPTLNWNARDNLFHQMSVLSCNGSFDNDYNAYYLTTPLSTGGGNITLYSLITYTPGPLGKWYLAETGDNAPVRDAGSRSPGAAGLFHHTTRLNQTKAGLKPPNANRNNLVWIDIGFHYVASEAMNLAQNKYVIQSSTDFGGVAERAIDGNTSGIWTQNSVTHTAWETRPWWQVDLGSIGQLSAINIWNRAAAPERLSNYYVLVSDNPFLSTDLTATLGQQGVSSYYQTAQAGFPTVITVNRAGRYIRVQLSGDNYLSIAELEAIPFHGAMDFDGDMLPDYFEDRNGNGTRESQETNWQDPDTDGDGISDGGGVALKWYLPTTF